MTARDRIKKVVGQGVDKAKSARETIRERDDAAAHAVDIAESASKTLFEQLKKGTFWVVSKSAEKIGADRYREELDAALQEALRVISVQEERIALLEQRLAGQE